MSGEGNLLFYGIASVYILPCFKTGHIFKNSYVLMSKVIYRHDVSADMFWQHMLLLHPQPAAFYIKF